MKISNDKKIKKIVYAAAIAALYVVLTVIFAPISFGAVQVRISEALCIAAIYTYTAVPGLTIGCFLANVICGATAPDIIFGSLATLIGSIGTYMLRNKRAIWAMPPILANAIIVPFVLKYAYGSKDLVIYMMLTVGGGEVISVGIIGSILKKMVIDRLPIKRAIDSDI